MKRLTAISLVWLAGILVTGLLVGCRQTIPENRPTTPPSPSSQTKPTIRLSGQPDLQIVNIRVEQYNQAGLTHQIIATIKNNGAEEAKGFNAGCTYKCPGGTITSAGIDIVQAGYILANQQFTYQSPFRFQCEPRPAFVNLECTVNCKNDSNRNNDSFSTSIKP
jgi:hypothetical protein